MYCKSWCKEIRIMWREKSILLAILFISSTSGSSDRELQDSCPECPPMSTCTNGICVCRRYFRWKDPLKKKNCVFRPRSYELESADELRNVSIQQSTQMQSTVVSTNVPQTSRRQDNTTTATTTYPDVTSHFTTVQSPTVPILVLGIGGGLFLLILLVAIAIIVYCYCRRKKLSNFEILP